MYTIATNVAAVIFQLDPYSMPKGTTIYRKLDGQHGHSEDHGTDGCDRKKRDHHNSSGFGGSSFHFVQRVINVNIVNPFLSKTHRPRNE